MQQRTTHFSQWMRENGVDVSIITSTENVFYLSGFYSDPHERLLSLVLFQEEEPFLVCPAMEKEDAKKSGWNHEILGYNDIENPWELVRKAIGARIQNVSKVSLEKEHMNVERFEAVSSMFPKAVFSSAEDKLRKLRMIKDPQEISLIREACKLADYAVEVGCAEIKEGKTELEIVAAIEYELKKKGITDMSFATMVLTGANGASPHGTPGQTKIQKGDFVLFDLGVIVDGYCSDITRTVAYGEINDKQKEIYDTVLKAQLAAIEVSKPEVTCANVDFTARKIITDAGYGDYFPHRLGHGLGIGVHEYPSLTETNDLQLEAGMVYTIEPGIYVPNVAGVRIEDDILVTKNGVEILTKCSKELQYI